MKFKFEDLIIWQKGMDLGEDMNSLAYKFPKDVLYNLSSQLRRAADSVALNISEVQFYNLMLNIESFWGIQYVHWQKL